MIGHNCDRWDTVLYQPLGRLNIGLFDLCGVFVCVFSCVYVCVCVHVYVVYEDTNLYNDMGMT